MYMEARSEPVDAMVAVAAITLNRSKDQEYPNSVCEVVYMPSAFTWTKHRVKIKEKVMLERTKQLATLYTKGRLKNPIGSRKFFNHKRLGKRFKTPYKPIVIGQLMFY
jgi:spore germination cell wall hydrolase CwlJ-like protein